MILTKVQISKNDKNGYFSVGFIESMPYKYLMISIVCFTDSLNSY